MALFDSISQMVASTRPRVQVGGGGAHNIGTVYNKDEKVQGYGNIGEAIGKGFGNVIQKEFDPETQRQRAMQTRELLLKMPPELQKAVYSNPDVQEQLKKYYRWSPELFADAGLVTQDEAMRGQMAFVGDTTVTQSLEKGAEEVKGTKATTKLREAQAVGQEQSNTLDALIQNIKVAQEQGNLDQIRANIGRLEEAVRASKVETGIKEAEAPLQRNVLTAQAQNLQASARLHGAQADEYSRTLDIKEQTARAQLARVRAASKEDPVTKRILDTADKYKAAVAKEYGSELQYKRPEFAMRWASTVNSGVVQAFGVTPIKTEDGATVYLPAVLQNPAGMIHVNNAIDTVYSVVADKQTKLDGEKLDALYNQAAELYDNVHGKLARSPKLNAADDAALKASIDPRAEAKLLFIQWMKEKKNGVVDPRTKQVRPLSKNEEEEYRQKIASVGGLPTPMDKPSLWESMWSITGQTEVPDTADLDLGAMAP